MRSLKWTSAVAVCLLGACDRIAVSGLAVGPARAAALAADSAAEIVVAITRAQIRSAFVWPAYLGLGALGLAWPDNFGERMAGRLGT